MHRTTNAFSVLQAIAVTVGLTIILWSLGLPSFRFAEAAYVVSYSDTLSDSAPSVGSDHTITFTTLSGVPNNTSITLDFTDGSFGQGGISYDDVSVSTTSDFTVGAAGCGGGEQVSVDVSGWPVVDFEFCNGVAGASIPANGTTTIKIGTNAGGSDQIVNPVAGSYEIDLTAGVADTGTTRVAIVSTVNVTATVDTVFDFTVTGVAGGQTVNGTTTGASTTATDIAFGKLEANTASTGAQDLTVVTNARNGFVVTVEVDGMLRSTNGADIDGFANGGYDDTPASWESPSPTLGQENTYGHWGITSDDTDYFASGQYVSASTTPREIFANTGPVNGAGSGVGTTRVGYTVEITTLQEAADDYQATLTYVATPVF